MPRPYKKTVLIGALLLIFILFFALGGLDLFSLSEFQNARQDLVENYERNKLVFMLGYMLLYATSVALSLPIGTVLTVAGGAIFGWMPAFIMVLFSSSLGSIGPFFVSRYTLKDWVDSKYRKALKNIYDGIEESGWWYILSARLNPVMPFYLINFGSGITNIRFKSYISATFLGVIPGTFIIAYTGSQLGSSTRISHLFHARLILGLFLLAFMPLLVRYIQKNIFKLV